MNITDLLNLAGDQGKVVVVGEDGEVKGVFLLYDEYKKLDQSLKVTKDVDSKESEAEKINREILQAQLEEVIFPSDVSITNDPAVSESTLSPNELLNSAERIDSLLNRRAQNLFRSIPYEYNVPDVNVASADEEIKPNFDDI